MSGEHNANRATHAAVVDLAANYLAHSGLPAVGRPYYRSPGVISSALAGDLADPDVSGLPEIHMMVTSRLRYRFGDDLDRARRGADINGTSIGAFIQWRAGRGVDQSFVVMSLADFSKLVGGSPPTH